MHESDMHQGMGIVVELRKITSPSESIYTMVTVHWLNGMGVGDYWINKLEVLCK